jgi:hypothetical protein
MTAPRLLVGAAVGRLVPGLAPLPEPCTAVDGPEQPALF